MEKWYLMNVIWYDGYDAFVSKFIGKIHNFEGEVYATKETIKHIEKYLEGNGEVLKIDPLYSLNFDNIIALKDSDDKEQVTAYNRFVEIYF